jgi:hypothetical protein
MGEFPLTQRIPPVDSPKFKKTTPVAMMCWHYPCLVTFCISLKNLIPQIFERKQAKIPQKDPKKTNLTPFVVKALVLLFPGTAADMTNPILVSSA